MSPKKTRMLIFGLGILYFIVFIIPNASNAENEHALSLTSPDESIQYATVMRMITPGKDIHETRYHWISYGHYYYGYPFYLLSASLVYFFRMLHLDMIITQVQLDLLVLRQFINVLPMTVAIILLVYMQTRFKNWFHAVVLFILLSASSPVVRSNICWWHPDSLSVLAVVLTLYFLDKDRLSYSRNFYLAAIACGVSIGIKVIGVFFALLIPCYLLAGWLKKHLSVKQAVVKGVLFIMIMAGVVVLTNPLLLTSQRSSIIETQQRQGYYVTHGWEDKGDPTDVYERGPISWTKGVDNLLHYYLFLSFSLLSLAVGCFKGPNQFINRLIAGWIIPYSIYLMFFVAIKNDHYWLPITLPVISCSLSLVGYKIQAPVNNSLRDSVSRALLKARPVLVALILAYHMLNNMALNIERYTNAIIGN